MSEKTNRKKEKHSAAAAADEALVGSTVTNVTSQFGVTVPDGTQLWYVSSDMYSGTNSVAAPYITLGRTSEYVQRKLKQPKKLKGDKTMANHPSKRLRLATPVVMYRFIKDRFRLLERRSLSVRLEKIAQLMENAKVLGQIALADKVAERFGKLIREQELLACGYTQYIPRRLVTKFMSITTTDIIKLTPLKNYVRVIPKNVQAKLDDVQKRKLFDGYLVMHTDVNNTAVEKTLAEKKDPILFGTLNDVSDNLYHIISWEDEFCGLTFDKLIDKLGLDKEEYEIEDDTAKSFMDAML